MDESGAEQPPIIKAEVDQRSVPEVKGENPISQTVVKDLERKGEIFPQNIGSILAHLRNEIRRGISLVEDDIKIFDSAEEALPLDLIQAMQTAIVYHNEPIQREEIEIMPGYKIKLRDFFRDDVLRRFFDGDAYEEVLQLHRKLYGEDADVKLVRYNETLVVVTERRIDDNLRIIQVLDCDFPQTANYKEFRRKVREENLDPASWPGTEARKENYIPVHHLIIQDAKSGKAFDFRAMLPKEWTLRYIPTETSGIFMLEQSTERKFLKYGELSSPELLVGLFHEFGHCLIDTNYPEFYKEVHDLWDQIRWTTGGAKALPPELVNKAAGLVAKNERGASARAIQILRILDKQGLDIGVPVVKITELVNSALTSQSRAYPGAASKFLRTSTK